ncbi:hypothetical protein KKA23_01850 [Patescibacteria group bacterium]|nr:hypothetical protein [Patescibacteria group bacterium]MBU3922946.1 hypothetical protein [Patescibacteria group bacterium]
MAIEILQKEKKQKTLLIVAFGILIITAVFLYSTFWAGEKTQGPEEEINESDSDKVYTERDLISLERKLKEIEKIDLELLNEKILPFLKKYGDIPLRKGEAGRINPFIPYD